ncbi:MAG: hypothetical protein EP330_16155 [Deltaproteobacteria bacterium]|nr:MAG: hypothetical protein EP330_16155 [Deltaproteobacteria bacterium]
MGTLTPERAALLAIAGVLSRGVTDEDLDWLTSVPGLEGVREWSEDERLAEHERVLGRGVFAFRSVFLREDALRVEGESPWFAAHGLEVDEPDALGSELALLARTADPKLAAEMGWAVAALFAVERQGGPLYPTLAAMARALMADLGVGQSPLPPVSDPLDDERTGLRRLAEHLLVPVKSGWFLSRGDLLRLAEAAESPCGFGSRTQMMEAFFRTAVEHERLPEAVAVLQQELSLWEEATGTLAATWSKRAAQTSAMLARLSEAALAAEAG